MCCLSHINCVTTFCISTVNLSFSNFILTQHGDNQLRELTRPKSKQTLRITFKGYIMYLGKLYDVICPDKTPENSKLVVHK